MSFDFELLMLKPTPQEEKGVSIFFPQTAGFAFNDFAPLLDRKQLLQHLLPSLSMEWPAKMASKIPVGPHHIEDHIEDHTEDHMEDHMEDHKEDHKEDQDPDLDAAKEKDSSTKAYQAHKDTVRGRLVIQAQGQPWICPHIALLEGKSDNLICVYSKVAHKTWWARIVDKNDAEMQFWEFISGTWHGTRDKPSNFRQLADVDQEAIHQQMLNELKKKYKLLDYKNDPGDSSVILLDDVEDFCESVLQKNVDAVRLYNHLMSSSDLRIVALTQYPCYRDPEALVHLFNLLHGHQRQKAKTRRLRSKGHRNTKRQTEAPRTTLLLDKLDDDDFVKKVSPMIVKSVGGDEQGIPFFRLERCEMTVQQWDIYRHETDAARQRMCCAFAMENRPKQLGVDIVQQTLYERELVRIVDEQDVSLSTLETHSPKFLRVLQKILEKKDESKGGMVVFTSFEMEGQLFRSMLEHHGFDKEKYVVLRTEADVVALEHTVLVYLMIAPTTDMWFTGSQRLENIHTIHLLDIPDQSWVQTLRIGRKSIRKPVVYLYVSTFSQKSLIKNHSVGPKSKYTRQQDDDGSELYKYCKKYLGDVPSTVTADEQLLEELLTLDRIVHRVVTQIV